MGPRRLLTILAPSLAALAFAGCGGGGGDSSEPAPVVTTPTTTALSKAELLKQGDAICAEVNAAVGSVATGESESETGQVADLYVGMVESLKRLGAPQEAAGYAEVSSAADQLSQAEGEVKLAAERGDSAGLATAEANASSALASFQSAAAAYGFEDCAEGPSAPVAPGAETPGGESEAAEEGGEEAPTEEAAPEAPPETGGAGSVEEGGGAPAGGGTGGGTGGGAEEGGGGSSGGIGPG